MGRLVLHYFISFIIQLPAEAQLSARGPVKPARCRASFISAGLGVPVLAVMTWSMYPLGIPASTKSLGACNNSVRMVLSMICVFRVREKKVGPYSARKDKIFICNEKRNAVMMRSLT